MRGPLSLAPAALVAVLLAGCSVGPARPGSGQLHLTVTRDFGARPLLDTTAPQPVAAETALALLSRTMRVATTPAGRVRAIAGTAARPPLAWDLFINGILVRRPPGQVQLNPGDQVWWDLRDTTAAKVVPAVVGSFPAPFSTGTGGKRLPVSVECGVPGAKVCATVGEALIRLGVPTAQGAVGSSAGARAYRVLVGPWQRLAVDPSVLVLAQGPARSGVYARVANGGREIDALDPRGRVVRRLRAGTGLIAVVQHPDEQPFWVVTGTDGAGVSAAASAFAQGETTLGQHYALAIADEQGVPLPVQRRRP